MSNEPATVTVSWPGKSEALREAQTLNPPGLALVEMPGESLYPADSTSENLIIEGDNLPVLKELTKTLAGQVKVIYIDPPYNTRSGFIYRDSAARAQWLSMMYSRLLVARELLRPDGIIFISIDDNEVSHLRLLCDEVFGAANFAGQLVWEKGGTGKNDSVFAVVEHEYVLTYALDAKAASFNLDLGAQPTTRYNRTDERGDYSLIRLDSKTLRYHQSLDFPIFDDDGREFWPEQPPGRGKVARWRWSPEKVAEQRADLVFSEKYVYTKNYRKAGVRPRSILPGERFGVTRTGRADAEAALGVPGVFEYPKPVALIAHLVAIASGGDDLVLDFFAGSGTTGPAVWRANEQDGGQRRFVLVQLAEEIAPGHEARRAGLTDIAQLCRARVRGASAQQPKSPGADFGFRALKIGVPTSALGEENS